jgi:hypothetical protein
VGCLYISNFDGFNLRLQVPLRFSALVMIIEYLEAEVVPSTIDLDVPPPCSLDIRIQQLGRGQVSPGPTVVASRDAHICRTRNLRNPAVKSGLAKAALQNPFPTVLSPNF